MSILVELWNLLWKEKSESEPEIIGDVGTLQIKSSQVIVTEAAPGPTENDIMLEMRQVEGSLRVSKEGLHSRYYQTFGETSLYIREIRASEDRLEYLNWFLSDLRARRQSEELWARLSLKQKRCRHLKGGRAAAMIISKDYNVSDHTFPDGTRQIKCLTCGWESWRDDERWDKALEMLSQSTNTSSSSEIQQSVLTGTLDKNKPSSDEVLAQRAADYKLGYQRIKEEMNSTEVRQVRPYTEVDVDTFAVADPPTNTIRDQIVEGMKLPIPASDFQNTVETTTCRKAPKKTSKKTSKKASKRRKGHKAVIGRRKK